MPNVTIKLVKPLTGNRGEIGELEFREPRFEDVMLLGEPTAPLSLGGDRYIPTPVPSIVRVYAERLLVSRGAPIALDALGLRDTLAVQKVILDFFVEAGQPEKSDDSAESSPSPATTTLPASAA